MQKLYSVMWFYHYLIGSTIGLIAKVCLFLIDFTTTSWLQLKSMPFLAYGTNKLHCNCIIFSSYY